MKWSELAISSVQSWGNVFRTIVLFSFLFGGIYVMLKSLGVEGVKVSTDENGTSFDFGSSGKYYNFFVHPRDWQNSGIKIKEGQNVSLTARGSINIGLQDIVNAMEFTYENRKEVPIESFSADEIQRATDVFPWTGPAGLKFDAVAKKPIFATHPDPRSLFLYREGDLAQLLAVIAPYDMIKIDGSPIPYNEGVHVIPIGSSTTSFTSHIEGELFFVINDVWLSGNLKANAIYWMDNFGFFQVDVLLN